MSTLARSLQVPAGDWRRAGAMLLPVVALVLLMYRETFLAMAQLWMNSEAFAHAALVAPISLWLVWRQRTQLLALTPRPEPWLAIPMLGTAALWLLGDLAGVNAITQIAATAMVVIAVVMLLGTAIGRALAFPLGFLFFMVPIGDFLVPQLMTWTADVTVGALRVFGVPVYREGQQFIVPTGSWSVVEACSGVRYLIVSIMVGFLFAYLNYQSNFRRAMFIAFAVLFSLVANWVRAILLVTVGHLSDNRLGVGDDHFVYGWVVYGIVIASIFWIGGRFSDREVEPAGAGGSRGKNGMAAASAPMWIATTALALAAAALPRVAEDAFAGLGTGPVRFELPAPGNALARLSFPRPEFVGAALQAEHIYEADGGHPIAVHVAYYRGQAYGRKLVSSQNALVKTSSHDWALVSEGLQPLALQGHEARIRTAELRSGGTLQAAAEPLRLLVRQIYWVDGDLIADDRTAAVRGLWGRLRGRGDDAAAITFYTTSAATGAVLDAFVARQLPVLLRDLERARAAR